MSELNEECEHLYPKFLCRICTPVEPWVSPTGRFESPPERQSVHKSFLLPDTAKVSPLITADFGEIEKRVMAQRKSVPRYRPET